ncbi:transposable element Tcb2 transposase [Trichonephila clavipes]|nr:transposable element Tcb2 transposase [Trichonephila clavipes]
MQRLPGTIFQPENARPHTARVSQDCLRNVTTLPWPARSPDLSPVDHILDHLERRVEHPTSLNELNRGSTGDERTFEILQNKTQFVRRRDGEKFHSDCVVRTVKHPTKIMIWSVISGKGTGRLDVVKGMMRQDKYKMSCKIA